MAFLRGTIRSMLIHGEAHWEGRNADDVRIHARHAALIDSTPLPALSNPVCLIASKSC
jgi:hypothetical protein